MGDQTIAEIVDRLNKLEERINNLEGKGVSPISKEAKNLSVREFILSKNPKDEIQKTLLVCYFLETNDGIEFFNFKDIENGFMMAKEKSPKNINYNVLMNIRKGYIMESREKKNNLKAWSLTNSGLRFVESDFIQNG